MPPHHPYLNQRELIRKVRSQFQTVDAPNNIEINRFLSNVSYYDLVKGLKQSSLKDKRNKFIPGFTLNHLYQVHWLNLSMSGLLLKYALAVEKHLKSCLAEVVHPLGTTPEAYLDVHKYKNKRSNTFHRIQNEIKWDTNGDYAKARQQYGLIPSWYLIQKISFGMAINWYAMLPDQQKTQIVNAMLRQLPLLHSHLSNQDRKDLLRGLLKYVLEVRNKSAHGGRAINLDIKTQLNGRLLNDAGIIDFFDVSSPTIVPATLANFIIVCLLLTGLATIGENIIVDLNNFITINATPTSNSLVDLNIPASELFRLRESDFDRFRKLIAYQY